MRCFSTTDDSKTIGSIDHVPNLKDFMATQEPSADIQDEEEVIGGSHLEDYFKERLNNVGKTYLIETHGCQMNVADTEIVASVLE